MSPDSKKNLYTGRFVSGSRASYNEGYGRELTCDRPVFRGPDPEGEFVGMHVL